MGKESGRVAANLFLFPPEYNTVLGTVQVRDIIINQIKSGVSTVYVPRKRKFALFKLLEKKIPPMENIDTVYPYIHVLG